MRAATTKTASWAPQFGTLAYSLINHGLPRRCTTIYNGRNRVVRFYDSGRDICVKDFKIPHIFNRIIYGNFRASKARRSFEHAIILRNHGFNTPEPLAYSEQGGLLFGHSYYISQYLPDFSDIRDLSKFSSKDLAIMADDLARLMARLREAGIWMKDFSQGNILWQRTAKGNFDFYLVDINRMDFNVTDHKKFMQNFKAVTESPRFLDSLARAYARHTHLNESQTVMEARAVRDKFLKGATRKKKFKNLIKKIGL